MPNKAHELLDEFRAVMGKVGLLDTIMPPVLFLLLNGLASFNAAMIGALGLSCVIALLRFRRGQSLLYVLAGLGSVALAIALALLLGRSEGFFLPGIVNGGLTVALALVSLLIRKADGGMDKLSCPPLAAGLVLARSSPPCLYRSDRFLADLLRRKIILAGFALSRQRGGCTRSRQRADRVACNDRFAHLQLSLRHVAISEIAWPERGRISEQRAPSLVRSEAWVLVRPSCTRRTIRTPEVRAIWGK